MANFVN
ncbi:hypothetical protein S40285_10933 [Stachybotrys chlorohalonatus IBT 40285]|nr:hypothetical protein S40285_10933 [Stachybotrys chlorohalonata IBT 40285]KFA74254.1 hypothetical protein S40288_11782 [Stachybotrys chartarum IBT 40288]